MAATAWRAAPSTRSSGNRKFTSLHVQSLWSLCGKLCGASSALGGRPMINGYGGSILRVDLTTRLVKQEPVTPELAHDWLGGRAWIAKFMYEELPAGVDPLSPANKVYMATGPLSGTLSVSYTHLRAHETRHDLVCRL